MTNAERRSTPKGRMERSDVGSNRGTYKGPEGDRIISQHPQEETTIPVIIAHHEHPFMVDTGITYSCIGKQDPSLPLSPLSIKTVGVSGKLQVVPHSVPIPVLISVKTVVASVL